MITVEDHLDRILSALRPLPVRQVPLPEALGCVLAEEVTARLAVPPFDNSAMDGFAVRAADVAGASEEHPVRLRVVGDLPAGAAPEVEVTPGTAVRIMTGAPLPPGADGVIPVERTDQPAGPGRGLPAEVVIRAARPAHVRRAGEDIEPGSVVLRAGSHLGPRALAAAASTGHGSLPVRPRLRLGVLSTGDELVPPGELPGPGRIPDSNSTLLTALAEQSGAVAVQWERVPDDPAALRGLLEEHLPGVDALVTVGGVSAGVHDVVKEVFAPLGEVSFDAVAMQPGKPQGFGVLHGAPGQEDAPGQEGEANAPGVPVFCLPGNPVSAFVSFVVFVEPALRVLAGLADPAVPEHRERLMPFTIDAVAAAGWHCPPDRRQYLPVTLDSADGERLLARPASAGGSGSHLVASLAAAQALAVVEADVETVEPGDAVRVMMVP